VSQLENSDRDMRACVRFLLVLGVGLTTLNACIEGSAPSASASNCHVETTAATTHRKYASRARSVRKKQVRRRKGCRSNEVISRFATSRAWKRTHDVRGHHHFAHRPQYRKATRDSCRTNALDGYHLKASPSDFCALNRPLTAIGLPKAISGPEVHEVTKISKEGKEQLQRARTKGKH